MTTTNVRGNATTPMTHEPIRHVDHNGEEYYTVEEFMDKLAKRLGKAYGLNDIREALV